MSDTLWRGTLADWNADGPRRHTLPIKGEGTPWQRSSGWDVRRRAPR